MSWSCLVRPSTTLSSWVFLYSLQIIVISTTMVAKIQVSSDFFQNSTIMFTWNNLGTICDSNVGSIETLVINETHKKHISLFKDFC
jgi:hypothetical protein